MDKLIIRQDKNETYQKIRGVMSNARRSTANLINTNLLKAYHEIGRLIAENEEGDFADSSQILLDELSEYLTQEFGRGFSRSNIYNMRRFYLTYPECKMKENLLTWSHYCEILGIDDEKKRDFYKYESKNSGWSVRQLKRQIKTSLYERLLLSQGKKNKNIVLELAEQGNIITKPTDMVKDPYVFEFLGIPKDEPILEGDLEKSLILNIGKFLLELGKGFMFVGNQQRITLGNTNYYVDMVFYNKILRSYVLIELKTGKLMPEAVGQLNMYLNYYKTEVNDENDRDPVGIVLCTDKDHIQAEYALGGLQDKIFASRYTLYIPDKDSLEDEVERVIEAYSKK